MFGDEFIKLDPKDNNLKTKNDIDCLYPVTCLTTLSLAEKDIINIRCDFSEISE
jgi:hypothetical protein